MPLSPADAANAWNLFKDSPLWARWPEFRDEIALRLSARPARAGETIHRPGDPADRLFLIGSGIIVQTGEQDGRLWFKRELRPGEFFGQQSLFNAKHETQATALTDATLYVMTAADLRVALDKNPELHESLLHEARASRLRSIPLFARMNDPEIRWLAMLVAEQEIGAGQSIALDRQPGLWVIEWGQVAVSGPASLSRPNWRLTAGNFFLTPQTRIESHCVADKATAALKTRFFYLAQQHFEQLLEGYPEIARTLRQPLDIARILGTVQRMAIGPGMTQERLLHLAQFCAWAFVPAGQNISTQGTLGYSFVDLIKGGALVSAVDDQGRLRPRNLLHRGEYFGFTSLLEGKPRDATARAVRTTAPPGAGGLDGAEIIILDRRDLQYAMAERPDLWHEGVWLFDSSVAVKEERPSFDWLEEGETVVRSDRPHWLWLAMPLVGVLLPYALVVLLVLFGEATSHWPRGLEIALLILGSLIFLPLAGWITFNYYDDYYAVTNRRVTRRDRNLLFWEARTDAPLEMVQDVTVDSNLIGRIFNYGNATVRTAAKVGAIKLEHVPDPDFFRVDIMRGKAEAAAAVRGQNKETLRRGLMRGLRLSLAVPDRDQVRALGERLAPPLQPGSLSWLRRRITPRRSPRAVLLPGTRRGKPAWFQRMVQPLPEHLQKILIGPPLPPAQPLPGQIVWHKHWINFFQRAGTPLLLTLLLAAIAMVFLFYPGDILGFNHLSLFLAWLVLVFAAGGWLWWEAVDFRNDVYAVTDDRIIDIERRPLGLSEERRESTLDRVQTVFAEQKGFWANVLNYGNVVIRTAAADAGFTFATIGAPKLVQRAIFQKLDNYRRKQDERAIAERQRALIEGLEVYHELREEREAGRASGRLIE
jgi:CRP-like cAMP-binding protein/membrane protein YdbS with pleckstrin-like domain